MTKLKTILFDLDGTLIDTRSDLADAVNYALVKTGHKKKLESEIVPHVGNGLPVLMSNVIGVPSKLILDQAISYFTEYYGDHCVDKTFLYAGVTELLHDLEKTHKMGVVTNKPAGFSEIILKKLGVRGYFDALFGGDSLPERKPHPAPVLAALKTLGGTPGDCLMLGDGPQDIQAGHAAGVQTCVATYGFGFHSSTLDLKPDYQIKRFNELKEIVT